MKKLINDYIQCDRINDSELKKRKRDTGSGCQNIDIQLIIKLQEEFKRPLSNSTAAAALIKFDMDFEYAAQYLENVIEETGFFDEY